MSIMVHGPTAIWKMLAGLANALANAPSRLRLTASSITGVMPDGSCSSCHNTYVQEHKNAQTKYGAPKSANIVSKPEVSMCKTHNVGAGAGAPTPTDVCFT